MSNKTKDDAMKWKEFERFSPLLKKAVETVLAESDELETIIQESATSHWRAFEKKYPEMAVRVELMIKDHDKEDSCGDKENLEIYLNHLMGYAAPYLRSSEAKSIMHDFANAMLKAVLATANLGELS